MLITEEEKNTGAAILPTPPMTPHTRPQEPLGHHGMMSIMSVIMSRYPQGNGRVSRWPQHDGVTWEQMIVP
jgi:hypothetical protein